MLQSLQEGLLYQMGNAAYRKRNLKMAHVLEVKK